MLIRIAMAGTLLATVPAVPAAAAEPAPGRLVSRAPLARKLWLPGTGRAYQVKYWTKDVRGRAAVSTGAVFLPKGRAPRGGWPVVSWAHGTVGVGDSCAPTRAGRSARDIKYLRRWIAQGYAIVATDYQGLGTKGVHPYGDGRTEARNVIDMVRAGRRTTAALSRKWVVIGQSQGGHAALFTASTAARYAPELDYRGAVATGAPSNIELIAPYAGPIVPDLGLDGLVTYFAYFLAGLRASHPSLRVDRYLTPAGVKAVDAAERLCYDAMHERVSGLSIGAMLARDLNVPAFSAAIRSAIEVPLDGYGAPFYVAHGVLDTDVPLPLTYKLVADLRARHRPVTFKAYPGADHSANMFASLPDTLPFVRRLLR
ncbi:lipase family protein [Actinocorallia longicatena]|uniref:Prolyl oligopeptidase family serine peptidase n=1 Tax=Actinocorallia longicatena TaxID=111803 RepID=A0ABP6Q043_9ACTN